MKPYIFWMVSLWASLTMGQTLSGTITSPDAQPIEYVAVFNKNTGTHTHTNAQGFFQLKDVSSSHVIYFSHIGYETLELPIAKASELENITLVLQPSSVSLAQIVITPEINTLHQITDITLKTQPVKSSQEILRQVPGLFIGQHAGGGKAEQIFLRGFDIDHGTDINLSVDGLPINMVSHAHGQGYSDLHFIIPETLEDIEFGKGPYYADRGDFTTAGYVSFATKDRIDRSAVSVEYGDFDSFRTVGMFNILETERSDAYIAASLNTFDGPFVSPQNFNRFNAMAKYRFSIPREQSVTLTASHFQSKWDASGQIPQRAVDAGIIGRFGAIDDTEGGNTRRTNILMNHEKQLEGTKRWTSSAYYTYYDFELFSNFTFFLEDPINGDQIAQRENRNILGFQTALSEERDLGATDFSYEAGLGVRYDDVNDIELSHTKNRNEILERRAFGNVDQINAFAFLNTEFDWGKWKLNPAVRLDYFKFDYENFLSETYDNQSERKAFVSPKLNVIFAPTDRIQFFLKNGIGFHSNDARVVVANNGEDILPAAYGSDLGSVWKLSDKLIFDTALWVLFLEQEFVYVGDAGIVEPSGKTRRMGIDIGLRYEPVSWLQVYTNANYTYARSTEAPEGANFIPLAPDFTSVGGIAVTDLHQFSGGLSYRYIKDRPANEDNSIVAEGYFVTDANINYTWNQWRFGIIVENLFDTEWNETQFATESRLANEPAPVEEIHFTPGTPFFLRGKVTYQF
ncbi:TonB-dependent receptor [Altibacter sp. HG106]|uniref:TonB-dependent receptor n=1 Tax=Altibacter sp. HG106 TaxID=3023937 RepID=UPI0023507F11|nr:TonB-dependent receptor [Altibacter sp. HG106]MDC7995123.1 TonB-dependent receptor [Altibacter sp. HG106]